MSCWTLNPKYANLLTYKTFYLGEYRTCHVSYQPLCNVRRAQCKIRLAEDHVFPPTHLARQLRFCITTDTTASLSQKS